METSVTVRDLSQPGDLGWVVQAQRRRGLCRRVRLGHGLRGARREDRRRLCGQPPEAMPFLSERGAAVLGSDGNNDTAPSNTEGVGFPVHVLALNAMGVLLLDYLQLEIVSKACGSAGRWEFLFVTAPLRITGGTGSPSTPSRFFSCGSESCRKTADSLESWGDPLRTGSRSMIGTAEPGAWVRARGATLSVLRT